MDNMHRLRCAPYSHIRSKIPLFLEKPAFVFPSREMCCREHLLEEPRMLFDYLVLYLVLRAPYSWESPYMYQ